MLRRLVGKAVAAGLLAARSGRVEPGQAPSQPVEAHLAVLVRSDPAKEAAELPGPWGPQARPRVAPRRRPERHRVVHPEPVQQPARVQAEAARAVAAQRVVP